MFLEQISTVCLLHRVLEGLEAALIPWSCKWACWLLSAWGGLRHSVLYFWSWARRTGMILRTYFTWRINNLPCMKGGVEPWAGDHGTSWAMVGNIIILHRWATLKRKCTEWDIVYTELAELYCIKSLTVVCFLSGTDFIFLDMRRWKLLHSLDSLPGRRSRRLCYASERGSGLIGDGLLSSTAPAWAGHYLWTGINKLRSAQYDYHQRSSFSQTMCKTNAHFT